MKHISHNNYGHVFIVSKLYRIYFLYFFSLFELPIPFDNFSWNLSLLFFFLRCDSFEPRKHINNFFPQFLSILTSFLGNYLFFSSNVFLGVIIFKQRGILTITLHNFFSFLSTNYFNFDKYSWNLHLLFLRCDSFETERHSQMSLH